MRKHKLNYGLIKSKYLNGFSTIKIASDLCYHPRSVQYSIRKMGIARECVGKDIERLVATKLVTMGKNVFRMNHIHPYDLLVDGKRVDVKSAHLTKTDKYFRYVFQLQDLTNRKNEKNFSEEVDSFYLVFLDEYNSPVYSLESSLVEVKSTITITDLKNTKYKIKYLTNLN